MTILLGATLPVLAAIGHPYARLTSGVIGALIAGVSGANAAYRWSSTWQAFTLAQTTLELALAKWDLEVEFARQGAVSMPDLRASTVALVERAAHIRLTELEDFFSTQEWEDPARDLWSVESVSDP